MGRPSTREWQSSRQVRGKRMDEEFCSSGVNKRSDVAIVGQSETGKARQAVAEM